MIERQSPDTEKKATKLLGVADAYRLEEQRKAICRVMATKRLKQNRFGSALSWLVTARDADRLAQLSGRVLDDYLSTGTLEDIESCLEKLDPNFAFSDKLAFIEKYREIQLYRKAHLCASFPLIILVEQQLTDSSFAHSETVDFSNSFVPHQVLASLIV